MTSWRPIETYAPFARVLVQFMWEARPPLNPNQLADRVGIRRQLLSTWLNSPADARIAPEPAVLLRIARVLERPVDELFTLVGHTTANDPLFDRTGAWAYVIAHLRASVPCDPNDDRDDRDADASTETALASTGDLSPDELRACIRLLEQRAIYDQSQALHQPIAGKRSPRAAAASRNNEDE
jgi:transcriptional regulator with XRE-family HTH domain